MSPSRVAAIAVAVISIAAAPSGAAAASLVFVRDANVWIAAPDGSGARALTTDGTRATPYMSPSEDDHGIVVAQRGSVFVRLDQAGRILGTIRSLASDAPAGASGFGPFSPRVSPDGTKLAYYMGYVSGSYDSACQCTLTSDEEDVVYARTDGAGVIGATRFWRSPSWTDNVHVILAAPSNRQTAQIGFADMGASDATGPAATGWFSDNGQGLGGYMVDLDQPDLARTLDRLAIVRGMAGERLALYSVAADGTTTLGCELTTPAGSYARPAWSPDGHTLTFSDRQGVWSVAVPDDWASTCDLHPVLLVSGAADAGWSGADISPPPPTGGNSSGDGTPPPAGGGHGFGDGTPPPVRLRITHLSARALTARHGLEIDAAATEPARLTVTVASCRSSRCRTIVTTRRGPAVTWRLTLRRRLSPGRYRIGASVSSSTGSASATRIVRVR